MFKSLRWKITLLFILLVTLAELIIGTVGIIMTANYFHNDFMETINASLEHGLRKNLDIAANSVTIPQPPVEGSPVIMEETSNIHLEGIRDTMNSYLGRLAMSASRTYAILDGKTAAVLYSSVNANKTAMTPVISSALNGNESFQTNFFAE